MAITSPNRTAVLAAAVTRLGRPSSVEPLQQDPDSAIATLPAAQPARLRLLLGSLDAVAAASSWACATLVVGQIGPTPSLLSVALIAVGLAVVTVVVANARQLYRPQVCSIRAMETQRLGQVALLVGAATAVAGPQLGLRLPAGEVVLGSLLTFVVSGALRYGHRSWLAAERRHGRFQRPIVIVGGDTAGRRLYELVAEHPQLGLDVIGLIGEPDGLEDQHAPPCLGPVSRTEELVRASGATGVLLSPSAVPPLELNRLTRNLLHAGVHVHVASGLSGFAAHRVRPHLLGHESVLSLEPLSQDGVQILAKRAIDLLLATILGLLSLPILAVAALAIKLEDGGPVVFRQARVGRGGKHFTILKLRSMVPDAEARYAGLASSLAARTGPLVKLHSDPRITRVGRVLRATSIDELPQLLNVLGGSMSLVGPRPNLLVEAEGLDPAYLAHKCKVRPGISGLWQVEARDDPSFSVYRRLDLFYVENWSIGLDLAILLATGQRVTCRALRLLLDHRRGQAGGAEAAVRRPSME